MSAEENKPAVITDGSNEVALRIKWVYPQGQVGLSANQMLVQFDGHDFHLSFFDLKPPIAIGTSEERRKTLESIEAVEAICVSRVVVNKSRMKGFIETLQSSEQMFLKDDVK